MIINNILKYNYIIITLLFQINSKKTTFADIF